MNEQFELLSVSEVAKLDNKSIQTVYNHIRFGLYDVVEYKRGTKMRGVLIKYPKDKLNNHGKQIS